MPVQPDHPEPCAESEHPALVPPPVNTRPGAAYADETHIFHVIPGLERAPNERLWALWYAGGPNEPGKGAGNHVLAVTSDDDGDTSSEPQS